MIDGGTAIPAYKPGQEAVRGIAWRVFREAGFSRLFSLELRWGDSMVRCLLVIVAFIAILIAAAAAYVWSGYYNVAATVPHWNITYDLFQTMRDRSIAHHSKGIISPQLSDPKLSHTGFVHFHTTCRLCHGAPGMNRTEFARGLYPGPPDLGSRVLQGQFTDAELFWIVRNGIKMTGMPSFADSVQGEEELWGIVAFLRKLPELDPDQYKALVTQSGLSE